MNLEESLIVALSAALASSILAPAITNWIVFCREKKAKKQQEKSSCRKLAKALKAEISALIKLYEENKLPPELPQQGSNIPIVKIGCNYLSVFENNTDKLGILEQDDISDVISFYIQTKGLIDTLSVLSERWNSYAMYSRMGMSNQNYEKERELRLIDVNTVYPVALRYQNNVLCQYQSILDMLDKY